MSMRCLTFAYNAGGIKETIIDGKNGFMFKTTKELIEKTIKIIKNPALQFKIQNTARKTVQNNFSYCNFKKNIKRISEITN